MYSLPMKEKGEHFCVDRRLCPKMEPSWGTIHVNASTVPKNCGFIKKIGGTNQKKSALCPNPSMPGDRRHHKWNHAPEVSQ